MRSLPRIVWVMGLLGGVVACTPGEVEYCRQFGVAGTAEYGKCVAYYYQQQAAFDVDRAFCAQEADRTYPLTLYDSGRYEHVLGGMGPHGTMYGGSTIRIEPDYRRNALVDQLRMRIIAPCMQGKGWNSPTDWQAGHHAPSATAPTDTSGTKLPWLK